MTVVADAVMISRAMGGRIRPAKGPFKLTAAVTYTCHQRCTHCRIWKKGRGEELSAGEWRQIWRQASAYLSWLDLTGGEVTDRPDFAEIAIAAHEECAWLAMLHYPSNGRHPDRLVRVTQAILDARPRRLVLSISLDGPPKLHDRLRGDKGAYQAAVESYRKVRELGVEAYFGMTLSPWNMDQVDATFDALKADVPDLTWRELHFNFLHHSEHYFENQGVKSNDTDALVNTVNAILKRRGSARRPTHMMENLYLGRIEDHVRTGKSSVPCQSMIGHAFINPKGAVYPCHIWDRPIGNLRDHAFALDKIWALEQAAQVRQEVAAERCPGCWTPCEAYPSIMANLPLYVTSMVR